MVKIKLVRSSNYYNTRRRFSHVVSLVRHPMTVKKLHNTLVSSRFITRFFILLLSFDRYAARGEECVSLFLSTLSLFLSLLDQQRGGSSVDPATAATFSDDRAVLSFCARETREVVHLHAAHTSLASGRRLAPLVEAVVE